MKFERYQHVEKLGNLEVNDITIGKCFIFPKIDGTNASVWLEDNKINAGSRNRHLTGFGNKEDNHGFFQWVSSNDNVKNLLEKHPKLRLFGEWLIPHSVKTYRKDAWKRFYVFDVIHDEKGYLTYDEYKPILDEYDVDYIPPIAVVENPSDDMLMKLLEKNVFLNQEIQLI